MSNVRKYQGVLTLSDTSTVVNDAILVEKPLQISINGNVFTVTMTTPNQPKELAIGLLYAEGILKDYTHISNLQHIEQPDMDTLNVSINDTNLDEGYMNSRNFLSLSSCGICGKTELPQLSGSIDKVTLLNSHQLLNGFEEMNSKQLLFKETGGCHAAGVLDKDGNLITVSEDIGRHNAVDKVVGTLLKTNQLKEARAILVSGRISYEIVIKSFRAKIKQLIAVSAPSSLAIDYSKELGIALYGFCRENKFTRYA